MYCRSAVGRTQSASVVGTIMALALAHSAAMAQPEIPAPTTKWAASHFLSNAAVTDEGVDTVFWYDTATGERWVYVTGYVTDAAYANATRMVTLKYQADAPGPTPPVPAAVRYFPPIELPVSGTNKAVAMTVNPATGDIYVVGEAKSASEVPTHQDYVLIRYNKNLVPEGAWLPQLPYNLAGVRHYDGGINGNDRPADVVLSQSFINVVVTGTSAGLGTGDDIATVAWDTNNGARSSDVWPDLGAGPGVRRYNNAPVNGNDRGVELGGAIIACQGDSCVLDVVVLGTSYGGAIARDDILVLNYGAPFTGDVRWSRRYDSPNNGDDVATGLALNWGVGDRVFVCGHTPHYSPPTAATGFGAMSSSVALQRDYVVLSYIDRFHGITPGVPNPGWVDQGLGEGVRHYDWFTQDDFAADIQWSPFESNNRLWVTGRVRNGVAFDTGTLKLDAADATTICAPVFATNANAEDQPANLAPTEFWWGRDQNGFITGFSTVVLGLPERFATLRYDLAGAPCQLKWLGLYDTPGGSAVGRAATTEDRRLFLARQMSGWSGAGSRR